jgi:hypothetical protein
VRDGRCSVVSITGKFQRFDELMKVVFGAGEILEIRNEADRICVNGRHEVGSSIGARRLPKSGGLSGG